MMQLFSNTRLLIAFIVFGAVSFSAIGSTGAPDGETVLPEPAGIKTVIQVFYKEKQPSMQTLEKVRAFLKEYEDTYDIRYLLITDLENENSTVFFNILGYNSLQLTTGPSVEGRCLHVQDGDEITVLYEEQSPKRLRKDTAVWHALEYNPPPSESDLCK